jgi:hypothetical protein
MALIKKTTQNLSITHLHGDKAGYADKGDFLPGKNIIEF